MSCVGCMSLGIMCSACLKDYQDSLRAYVTPPSPTPKPPCTTAEEREATREWCEWATNSGPRSSPATDFAAVALRLLAERDALEAEVARLRTAVDFQKQLWLSVDGSAESALEHLRNKGGQRAGIPAWINVSVLHDLKRRARDAVGFADAALAQFDATARDPSCAHVRPCRGRCSDLGPHSVADATTRDGTK